MPIDSLQFKKLKLYHFTDTRNLPMIRTLGGIWSMAELRRQAVSVPAPGGNVWSWDADRRVGMDQYVHLCLSDNHPMEWFARQEGRIERSIYLEVDKAILHRCDALYCPTVSNKAGAEYFVIKDGVNMIDYEVLYDKIDWNDAEVKARRETARKCEVLIPQLVAIQFIKNFPNG